MSSDSESAVVVDSNLAALESVGIDPATLAPAVLDELSTLNLDAGLTAAMLGKPGKEVSAALGIAQNEYIRLRVKHPSFKSVMDRARFEGLDALNDSTLSLVDENLELSPQLVKIKADLLCRYLAVADPSRYGEHTIITEQRIDLQGALTEARKRVMIKSQSPHTLSTDEHPNE